MGTLYFLLNCSVFEVKIALKIKFINFKKSSRRTSTVGQI